VSRSETHFGQASWRLAAACSALWALAALAPPAGGEDIRLFDNRRMNAMIEEVTAGKDIALKVTTMDGRTKTVPLADIVTIRFRGRQNRMLLTGTQELRFISGDRVRGRFLKNLGDDLVLATYALGEFRVPLDRLKGFVTMPRIGRAGRWADEMVDEKPPAGEGQFLDEVVDRRGSVYRGAIRKLSQEGVRIDHDAMLKVVEIPTLYLAGGRLAQAGRQPTPAFPSDVLMRISTRDGGRMDGWVAGIGLDQWQVKPVWDARRRLGVREEEIVAVQVLNSKRLYLSQLQPVRVKEKTSLAPPQPHRMDRSCQGDPLTIGSHGYPWGIGVHADSELTFKLGKAFRTFHAVTGIDSHSGKAGSVVFSVLGDGKVLYKGPVVRGSDPQPREVSVPVQGVDELTLKVTDAGDLDVADVANWALAQLLR